jgi:type IV pilus assembly protein PilW
MQIRGSGVVEYWSDGLMGENPQCQRLPARNTAGFTLIELLVAIALGLVILAGLFKTFKVQHDSYVIQDQVSAMQQNLRAAMYMITRDIQMAGYYTNFDRSARPGLDWNGDGTVGTGESGRPLVFAINDAPTGTTEIRPGTDVITIVKADYDPTDPKCGAASTVCRRLGQIGGSASGGGIDLGSWNLGGYKFGLLLKQDFTSADLFKVEGGAVSPVGSLMENYSSEDFVFRTDIITYKVKDVSGRPYLQRRNLANNNGYQDIAENIENLQIRYLFKDGITWTNDPTIDPSGKAQQPKDIRAVEVLLVARTAFAQRGYRDTSSITFGGATIPVPNDGIAYRRKMLTSIIKTRNIGL